MTENRDNLTGSPAEHEQVSLGRRLREAREVLGLKQEDVSAVIGIPRTSVVSMESGKRNVTATELVKLSALYRRSVEWLLGTEPDATVEGEALLRTTKNLSENDQLQVLRFAQFLANAGPAPRGPHSSPPTS
jgi:transcriptional regulator with XRE-family HTH domain